MSKTLTLAEVAAHDREDDCYLIIGNERTGGAKVYDVTKYLEDHPGGDAVLLELAGKYADDMFEVRPRRSENKQSSRRRHAIDASHRSIMHTGHRPFHERAAGAERVLGRHLGRDGGGARFIKGAGAHGQRRLLLARGRRRGIDRGGRGLLRLHGLD